MKGAVAIVTLTLVVLMTAAVGQGTNGAALIAAIIFFPAVICLYFAPAIVAWRRGHPRTPPITILNLFLGWTLIGWVAALVWAYTLPEDGRIAKVGHAPVADEKTCPYCAETIKAAAIRCRFCGADLDIATAGG